MAGLARFPDTCILLCTFPIPSGPIDDRGLSVFTQVQVTSQAWVNTDVLTTDSGIYGMVANFHMHIQAERFYTVASAATSSLRIGAASSGGLGSAMAKVDLVGFLRDFSSRPE